MKNFILGFILGALIFGAVCAYAATRAVWQNGDGNEMGTTANPVIVSIV